MNTNKPEPPGQVEEGLQEGREGGLLTSPLRGFKKEAEAEDMAQWVE